MRSLTLLGFLLVSVSSAYAQNCSPRSPECGSIRGFVLDSTFYNPVVDSRVILYQDAQVVATVRTDMEGQFDFEGVMEGAYKVVIIDLIGFPYGYREIPFMVEGGVTTYFDSIFLQPVERIPAYPR